MTVNAETQEALMGKTKQELPFGEQTAIYDVFPKAEREPRFSPLSWEEVMAMPPKEWIIPDLIGRKDLVQVYGDTNIGKTFIVLDLLFACITGGQFAGQETEQLERVVYMTGEGKSGIAARLRAMAKNRGASEDALSRLTTFLDVPQLIDGASPLSAEVFVEDWKATNAGEQVDLLVIDTQHAATAGGREDGSDSAGIAIQTLARIQEEFGCTIVLVHHAKKDGTASRGSGAWLAACDTQLKVAEGELSVEKQKDGEKLDTQEFSLMPYEDSCYVLWGARQPTHKSKDAKEEVLSTLTEYRGREFSYQDLSTKTGKDRSTIYKACKALLKEGAILERAEKKKGGGTKFFVYMEEGGSELQEKMSSSLGLGAPGPQQEEDHCAREEACTVLAQRHAQEGKQKEKPEKRRKQPKTTEAKKELSFMEKAEKDNAKTEKELREEKEVETIAYEDGAAPKKRHKRRKNT